MVKPMLILSLIPLWMGSAVVSVQKIKRSECCSKCFHARHGLTRFRSLLFWQPQPPERTGWQTSRVSLFSHQNRILIIFIRVQEGLVMTNVLMNSNTVVLDASELDRFNISSKKLFINHLSWYIKFHELRWVTYFVWVLSLTKTIL